MKHLEWPFFTHGHREFALSLDSWAQAHVRDVHGDHDLDATCRRLVKQLGEAGWLANAVAGRKFGGASESIDTRIICLAREALARHSGLADFAFVLTPTAPAIEAAVPFLGVPHDRHQVDRIADHRLVMAAGRVVSSGEAGGGSGL